MGDAELSQEELDALMGDAAMEPESLGSPEFVEKTVAATSAPTATIMGMPAPGTPGRPNLANIDNSLIQEI